MILFTAVGDPTFKEQKQEVDRRGNDTDNKKEYSQDYVLFVNMFCNIRKRPQFRVLTVEKLITTGDTCNEYDRNTKVRDTGQCQPSGFQRGQGEQGEELEEYNCTDNMP